MKILKNNIYISKYVVMIGLLLLSVIFSGCTTAIKDVMTEDNVGSKVTVHGTVDNAIKIGDLSGYTIKDETGTIRVSSDELPAEGSSKTVSGVLMHDTLFGYYIKVN